MRRAMLVLCAVPLLLSGCAEKAEPIGSAEAARAGYSCAPGEFVSGFDAAGVPYCARPQATAFACPEGTFVKRMDAAGTPECGAPTGAATTSRSAATQEVSSNLKVLNVYGIRPGTDRDVNELKVNVELAAGALPIDLSKLIVRWSDGTSAHNYVFGAAQANATVPKRFEITCIRGACTDADPVMRSGDLVEIYFSTSPGTYLPTRTSVEVSLVPETGSVVHADFKTPSTYASNRVVTLR